MEEKVVYNGVTYLPPADVEEIEGEEVEKLITDVFPEFSAEDKRKYSGQKIKVIKDRNYNPYGNTAILESNKFQYPYQLTLEISVQPHVLIPFPVPYLTPPHQIDKEINIGDLILDYLKKNEKCSSIQFLSVGLSLWQQNFSQLFDALKERNSCDIELIIVNSSKIDKILHPEPKRHEDNFEEIAKYAEKNPFIKTFVCDIPLYCSTFRIDKTLFVIHHLFQVPTVKCPALVYHSDSMPTFVADYNSQFESIKKISKKFCKN